MWVDCEMTGLSLRADALVEIACIVTEADLTEVDSGLSIVIKPDDPAALEQMEQVVVDMHTASGLLAEIPGGVSLAEAEQQVLDYVTSHVPEARKAPLAGSSVYVDRGFLARDMPRVDAHLHYRLVDVSTIKELAKRWYPRAYFASPEKRGNHRALGDIRESIAELRYYRDALYVPPPGPGSSDLKSIAAGHVVEHAASSDIGR